MKNISNRILALVCALVMVASMVLSNVGSMPVVSAAGEEIAYEWEVYTSSSEEGDDIVNSSTGKVSKEVKPNIQLPECAQVKNDLQIYVEVYIANEDALARMNDTYINVKNTSSQSPYYYWYLGSKANLTVGWNEITLKFSNAGNYNPTDGPTVDFLQPIQYFRFYSGSKENTTEVGTVRLRKMAIQNPDVYLEFGGDDTHLQISNKLTSAPEAIEVSVKQPELPTEWLLRSGHNTSWYWYGIGNQPITYGTTTADEAPGAGVNYAEPSQYPDGMFGFETTGFTANIPEDYDENDLELTFWIWSSKASTMGGQIWMSSSGSVNNNFISFSFANEKYANSDLVKLAEGWNKITLPMNEYTGYSHTWKDDGLDLSSINWFRWHDWKLDEGVTYKVSDFKIAVKEQEPEELEEQVWTLLQAGSTLNDAAQYSRDYFKYNQSVGTGTVSAEEAQEGLPEGTTYTKIIVSPETVTVDGTTYDGGRVGFSTKYAALKAPTFPEECTQKDLKIAFWIYSTNGKMPGGALQITTCGWNGTPGMWWYNNSKMKAGQGWRYVEVSLNDYNRATEGIDVKKMNWLRWYSDSSYLTEEAEYRLTDVKLIYTPDENAVKKAPVTVKEVTDVAGNQMIFSNTNVSGETPYALYITEAGYPALLWGTTQYTLEENVCTNEWETIKVVRNSEGYIEFYLNGQLKGKSEVVESDELDAFTTAHCIATDGVGGQIFNGRLANLSIYSDAAQANCMGSWQLNGNIEHVIETIVDASENANHAVFRGTRANDWVSYESVKADAIDYVGEDYWSMIFIPDIQNLAQTSFGYDKTWYTMAQWIADNVDDENVKHVIGAGDNTWSNVTKEYTIAQAGFDKFKNVVSWSNMSGNHEYTWNKPNRTSTLYDSYFGADYIAGTKAEETYVCSYDDPTGMSTTENSYYRFNVNGVNWMILQLEYYPRLSVLEWAKEIADQYPSDNVILTTHSYLSGKGGYTGETRAYLKTGDVKADGSSDYLGTSTEKIWTELQTCTNIKMILCGHATNGTGAIAQKNEVNSIGDTVPALMINAQDLDLESNGDGSAYFSDQALGMISILRFSEDGTKATVQLYCPQYDLSFDPVGLSGNRDSNHIQMSYEHEAVVKEYSNVKAGVAPTENVPEGYHFAGWYTDNTCKTAIESGTTVETAYAKFVDKNILDVKAQIQLVDNDGDGSYELKEDKTDLRFVTTVDSVMYQKVGFLVSYDKNGNGSKITHKVSSTNVYSKLQYMNAENGETMDYHPEKEFCRMSEYFMTVTMKNIGEKYYATEFTVTPFWVTLDGTTVYGEPTIKTISDAER